MSDEKQNALPARVQAALDFLNHCRWVTEQSDPSVAARELSKDERSVHSLALGVLRGYFAGEMDYGDVPPVSRASRDESDGDASPVPVTT